MDPSDQKQGETASAPEAADAKAAADGEPAGGGVTHVSHDQTTDATNAYTYYDDYGYEQYHDSPRAVEQANAVAPAEPSSPVPATTGGSEPPAVSTSGTKEEEEDPEEEGMLRMSFLDHLEELRRRIISALMGVGIAFVAAIYFGDDLWNLIQSPAIEAMKTAGFTNPKLSVVTPTEAFSIIWVKVPILAATFMASPWIIYQVWAFIAPGLYKRERRWAAPFVICTAGLFVLGGLFAYHVAFKLGLAFLLGIAYGQDLNAVISITEYFDLFVNVSLGMGIVFELPILIFFLTLLRILTPQFLVRNSRYAILIIVVVAALITPTPDVINLMLISVPMILLYFTGVLASYLLWISREGKKFPWRWVLAFAAAVVLVLSGLIWAAVTRYGYRIESSWPFLVR